MHIENSSELQIRVPELFLLKGTFRLYPSGFLQ